MKQNFKTIDDSREMVDAAIVMTCLEFDCTPGDLTGVAKCQHLVNARRVLSYLCRNYMQMNFERIGMILKRDHSTIIFHLRSLEDLLFMKSPVSFKLHRIESRLLEYKS